MSIKSFSERIANALIEDGLLLPSQLEEVVEFQKKQGGRLLKLLIERRLVSEEELVLSMGRSLKIPPINLAKVRVPEEILELLPKEMARNYKLTPVCRLANKLFVAMADPLNVLALDDLRQRTKLEIVPMIATERSILELLSGVHGAGAAMEKLLASAAPAPAAREPDRHQEIDLDRLAQQSEDAPVVKIVNLILVQALKDKASDIHIEPFEHSLKLRYRIDGVLVEANAPPKALQLPLSSRIKILAGLDIAERRLPQDGRFRIRVSGKEIDLRVSVLPTVHGEKIVIRILDKNSLSKGIETIGMDSVTLGRFKKAIDAPHGMILVTGPTGSGKTTTLYTVLQELNHPDYNIVTVEDPIEYQLPGINQVAVRSDIGLDFATALRSILRQDPDIVMVGEIRDNETADIAVKAALTGHQVLSTLHTNDAAGAITRLNDMGIEPFLIATSTLLTCAQRLVRRICQNCREEYLPDPALLAQLGINDPNVTFYQGTGCERCKHRGYAGRAALIEVLPITESIQRLILKQASGAAIKSQALDEGMLSLRMAGLLKAREGVTTLEEICRVTAED